MEIFIAYSIGFVIMAIGSYIFKTYFEEYESNKKLVAYESVKLGITSWVGIILCVCFLFSAAVDELDTWIKNKLEN